MAARTYKQLQARIAQLGADVLPAPSLTGKYPPEAQDLIKAYVLLTHAEIESFLEDIALDFIDLSERISSPNYCTPSISRLLIYGKHDKALPTADQIKSVVGNYRARVKNNHGIKATNVLSLFLPLGFGHTDFSQSILIALNRFGDVRGRYAHGSAAHHKTLQPLDPVSQRSEVEGILVEVENIARRLKSLK